MMKLQSINLARSLWFCPIFDFNPKGKSLTPVLPWLMNKYNFKKAPSPTEIPDFNKGVTFEGGEFRSGEGNTISLNFIAYNDGLVADTRSSTKDSDAFLIDLLTSLSRDFDLPRHEPLIRSKGYVSTLYVTTDKSLELINPKLQSLSRFLSDNVSYPYEASVISFWPDPAVISNGPVFTFERAQKIPFNENRYFSSAGLQTEKHLELLEKLESILSGS